MSAIAGIIHLKKEPVPFEHGRNIMKGLEKFPADDIQVWHKHNAFIGNHAQWITPESVGEQQPFYDSERQCVITADAIIDNREELFEKLQVERSKQKHMPDSQLILLAYYKWGEESPKHLVGDFAYMIWDERNQKLFGARDFSGSRTLYYYKDDERLAFCTTIMPLFTLPGVKKELNEEWMAEFLTISGVVDVVDTNITPYENIIQLPPSHSIRIEGQQISLSRYCYLKSNKKLKLKSDKEYEEAFKEIFNRAISDRTRTYKNIGAHLSGGLDSGAVVSFAKKQLERKEKKLNTYSYVPPEDFVDFTPKNRLANETPFIQATIDHVRGLNHEYLNFQENDPYLEIDSFLEVLEMPYKFFENSVWLNGIFLKASQDKVGVLLNGGRGNLTISWGPALEYYALLLKKIRWFSLYHEMNLYSKNLGMNKTKLYPYIIKMAFPFINRLRPTIQPYQSRTLISQEFAERTNIREKLEYHGMIETKHSLPDLFKEKERHFAELFHWNATNTLGTKLSLTHSVWKRDPTNDLRLIQFCLSVPENQYVKNGFDRSLIRRSTEHYLPDKVRLNQKVRGVQGVDWVHRMTPSWKQFINELEGIGRNPAIYHYLNKEVVESSILKVKEGPNADDAINPDYRIAIRSLIVYKFLEKFT